MPLYPNARHLVSVAILLLACVSLTSPALSDEVASDAVLPADHGYLLIRVSVNRKERINVFAFRNVDTNHEVRLGHRSFETAGSSAWMALVALPTGRYFWSEYAPTFSIGVENEQQIGQTYSRTAPSSADDSFEIAAGAVNYIGDWRMKVVSTARRRLEPVVQYNNSTLERFVAEYPDLAGKYEIYMSMMGKAAISLNELARILEEQAQ